MFGLAGVALSGHTTVNSAPSRKNRIHLCMAAG
jgi:hypothetical protein